MSESDRVAQRTAGYRRNASLDGALEQLNGLLAGAESEVTAQFQEPTLPQVFLVGNARSGTTLALQWLASSGAFAYPTNLLSRFFRAPYIGTLVQRVLTDPALSFRNELGEFQRTTDFTSSMGKTTGALAPHEFWYFWRRFFPNPELQQIDESQVSPESVAELRREFAGLEAVTSRPMAMKAMHMNFNVGFFARIFPRAVFVHIQRHPLYNLQSLLEARVRQFGTTEVWYSVKPPEFPELARRSPVAQVAGQVFHTNRRVAEALAALPAERSLTLDYESLCADPAGAFTALRERVEAAGLATPLEYHGPTGFSAGNHLRLSSQDLAEAQAAWLELTGVELPA